MATNMNEMPSRDGLTATNSYETKSSRGSPSKKLPLSIPADEDSNVFISLEGTTKKLEMLIKKHKGSLGSMFIRGSIACGKTTLATYLAKKFPDKYVLLVIADNERGWNDSIKEAAWPNSTTARDLAGHCVHKALKVLKESEKTVIVDEAHMLFSYPTLITRLFKFSVETPFFLLFSAAASAKQKGVTITTPPEIGIKYMWYPPMPNAEELAMSLKDAGVYLSDESVDFFLKMSSGHRGIFMRAVDWVKSEQEKDLDDTMQVDDDDLDSESLTWPVEESIAKVRKSLGKSAAMRGGGWYDGFRGAIASSRAVHVTGPFEDLNSIPQVFPRVLVEGGKNRSELENQ